VIAAVDRTIDAMQTAYKTPLLTLTSHMAAELDVDLLVIPSFVDDEFVDEPDLDRASGGEVGRARARAEFTGKPYEVLVTALSGWKALRVALVGVGKCMEVTPDHFRRLATIGGLLARQRRVGRVAVVFRPGTLVEPVVAAQAMAEGIVLASYDGGARKTAGPGPAWLEQVDIRIANAPAETAETIERGRILGECTNQARALANEPGNDLTPRTFAQRATEIATAAGLKVEVLDEPNIAALKMGMLLGVARGSQEPPRVVILSHEPKKALKDVVLGLVGKGITFDTGGISIKPADNMDKMKDDMSGGAAVLCAMSAIARLKLPVRCVAVIPMTENMPGGRAVKPGDVLTSAEGKTVEILNTDAEGRLILGDGLWLARQRGATHLVDVATLTGACVVALGKTTSGLFGTPATWVEDVRRASERAGDRSWPMPVFDDYKDQLKSEIADLSNTGGRPGGAITAALFIKEFAGDLPWVHMDIAGTAWAEEAKPYQPKGATGVGVRTLVELARDAAAWRILDKC
jgi:leucyl aminopeptidase